MTQSAAATSEAARSPLTVLTDEESLFRQSVREFAEKHVRPLAAQMDEEGKFSADLIQQFFDLGLMGVAIPEEYGGQGGSFFNSILAVEELSRVDASAGVIVDVQNTLVNNAILRWGNEEQKKRYLPKLAYRYRRRLCAVRSRVRQRCLRTGHQSRRQGRQLRAEGSQAVDHERRGSGPVRYLRQRRTRERLSRHNGLSGRKGFPGLPVGKKENKLGIRASSTCELILEECVVKKENVLGEVGKGYKIAIETLNEGRIGIGAQMVGLSQGALECGINYTRERNQFGQPIAKFQGVQFQIAQAATELEAARLMVYNAARLERRR